MADYKLNHTGAEIDSAIDKVDSNWSTLMANLGVGRWRNQCFSAWVSGLKIFDSMLKNYTDCSYTFAGVKYYGANESWTNSPSKKNVAFDSSTYSTKGNTIGMFKYFDIGGGELTVDIRNGNINAEQMFYGANVSKIIFTDTSNFKPWTISQTFWEMSNLVELPKVDCINVRYAGNMCSTAGVEKINFYNLNTSIDFHFCYGMSTDEVERFLTEGLLEVTTSPTLMLNWRYNPNTTSTSDRKLTEEQVKIATDKGWVVTFA